MKRMLSLLLALAMLFSLAACGKGTTATQPAPEDETGAVTQSKAPADDASDAETVGSVAVDEGLFDVTLSIPAAFADEDKTQADYDAMAKEAGYKSITLNDDGSLTYVMTKAQHKDMMDQMAAEFQKQLDEMCGSENYPNFVSIKAESNFSSFEIVTKSEELDLAESFSVLAFYMLSGMYNAFNGTQVENCKVTFINEASGAVIQEANSADAGE